MKRERERERERDGGVVVAEAEAGEFVDKQRIKGVLEGREIPAEKDRKIKKCTKNTGEIKN